MARAFVWLGGLLFVGSLGYLVYFYLVVLGSPIGNRTAIARNAAFDTALFSIFALHHSWLARPTVKEWVVRLVGAYERAVYVWVASLLLLVVMVWWQSLPGVAYGASGTARVGLHALQLVGLVLTIRGASVIDPFELAGIRKGQARTRPDDLKIIGPFRVVRHPIYLGWMLMVWATPTMTVNRLLFATLSSVYLILAIPWEERSLVAAHGDHYRAYQHSVRWRLVPGVW